MAVDRIAVRVSVPRRNRPATGSVVLVDADDLDRLEQEHEQMAAVCRALNTVIYLEPYAGDSAQLANLRAQLAALPAHLLRNPTQLARRTIND